MMKSETDSRWKVPAMQRLNKHYPPDFEERDDIKELKRRMVKPEADEIFRLIEQRDFVLSNRKQIGTLDTLRNYHTGRRGQGGQHRSLQPPKRALQNVNNTVLNNPKYCRALGLSPQPLEGSLGLE
jgi:hypothetical protein